MEVLHPYSHRAVTPKPACPPNGPRVYEPARRAQAVALLSFSNRRDRRAGCRRPSDRRERRVNPLLYACGSLGGLSQRAAGQPMFSLLFSSLIGFFISFQFFRNGRSCSSVWSYSRLYHSGSKPPPAWSLKACICFPKTLNDRIMASASAEKSLGD